MHNKNGQVIQKKSKQEAGVVFERSAEEVVFHGVWKETDTFTETRCLSAPALKRCLETDIWLLMAS